LLIADKSFASLLTSHLQPNCLIDLLRTALGLPREKTSTSRSVTGGPIAQAWQQQLESEPVVRYLLLLEDSAPVEPSKYCQSCPQYTQGGKATFISNSLHFHTARKLILELLSPKISDLLQSLVDRYSAPSTDTFRRAIFACITVLLLMPHFADSNSPQFQGLETDLESLILEVMKVLRESSARERRPFMGTLYHAIEPYIPACESLQSTSLSEEVPHLLKFFDEISRTCDPSRRDDSDSLSLVDG
jgi:ataxia telangiectasia mutated family protein